jgi:uncharacterized membrane protein YdfJ with MMPL/SSD domain
MTRLLAAHPVRTLLAVLAFLVVAGVVGGPVAGALDGEGDFAPKDADSVTALQEIGAATGKDSAPAVVLLVRSADPQRLAAVSATLAEQDGVAEVGDPVPSKDGTQALVTATLRADAGEDDVAGEVLDAFDGQGDVAVGGEAVASHQVSAQVGEDLGRAEALAFPVLVLLSLLFFRGRAALLPLLVGASTVLGTFLVLRGVNEVYGLSVFALNLVIGLGLGLAVDYSLFLVTRFREELADDVEPTTAIATTMRTAGRTVAFSAATVAAALATLTVFPLDFLKSMGIAGAVVAVLGALSALVVAPAFLALTGRRLARRSEGGRGWYRFAHAVMRRPGAVAVATGVVMLALAAPALRVAWTPVDSSVVPEDQSARVVSGATETAFAGADTQPIVVAIRTVSPDDASGVQQYADEVGATSAPRQLDARTWQLDLTTTGDPADDAAQQRVHDLRAVVPPAGVSAKVAGPAAQFVDQQEAIADRLPLGLGLLVGLTIVVLWLMTGSVVLPVKAVVMNALTVGSALGLLTVVYQDGRLSGLLGYTPNGGVEPTDFLVTAAVVFALSTDYGVFLLGRIKELRDAGVGEREAVAQGLQRTGRVVTAAAILLAVAIGAFSTSSISFIQQIGVASAFAVLVDAFVVRSLLVPALMGLLGRWNWWSPRPLRLLHRRVRLQHA